MRSLVIVNADSGDWIGIYDASTHDLIYQGHDIEPSRLLQLVGVSHTDAYGIPLADGSNFPRTLTEVVGFGGRTPE